MAKTENRTWIWSTVIWVLCSSQIKPTLYGCRFWRITYGPAAFWPTELLHFIAYKQYYINKLSFMPDITFWQILYSPVAFCGCYYVIWQFAIVSDPENWQEILGRTLKNSFQFLLPMPKRGLGRTATSARRQATGLRKGILTWKSLPGTSHNSWGHKIATTRWLWGFLK